jgi:predicted nicotinamide N-methyase
VPGYLTRISSICLGGHDLQIRALSDTAQFSDVQGDADRAGISSSLWGHFGQIWPSGVILAEAMCSFDVAGKRVLELGCGLGLASLVLARRHADITASDHHPLAEQFLAYNAGLNRLSMPVYRNLPWSACADELGTFDLIIGSDILYERGHSQTLAGLLGRLARDCSQIVISDPGRGNGGRMTRALVAQGYLADEHRLAFHRDERAPFRGRLLRFSRGSGQSPRSNSQNLLHRPAGNG